MASSMRLFPGRHGGLLESETITSRYLSEGRKVQLLLMICIDLMSYRKQREYKQQPSRAKLGHRVSCSLVVSFHYQCNNLITSPVLHGCTYLDVSPYCSKFALNFSSLARRFCPTLVDLDRPCTCRKSMSAPKTNPPNCDLKQSSVGSSC